MKVWPVLGVALLQAFLLAAHWFLFYTIVRFWPLSPYAERDLAIVLFFLAISFVIAAVLSFRFSNLLVEFLYKVAAVWLGLLNFAIWASCFCWIVAAILELTHADTFAHRQTAAAVLYGVAILMTVYGLANARRIRERQTAVRLPNLPVSWRGRKALLVSDMHLGNVNGTRFARHIAGIARRLDPDIVFIAGDLFDGSKVDAHRLVKPLFDLQPPLGVYFSSGNHEEFGDAEEYEATLARGGICVLHNQRVLVDGVQLIGIAYSTSTQPLYMRSFLEGLHLNGSSPSILLNHVPNRLPLVEIAGVNLQLSGHTHSGQILPFTWITRRAFGKFTYGLQRYGKLQVLTSSGAGTWGPPMRVGSAPEVVLITFN